MAESLNVIALISGGKDSFFSILHCIHNNHRVVALAHLYPGAPSETSDLNSYMYQTAGHNIIPHYRDALDLPLYRRPISGSPVNTDLIYEPGVISEGNSVGQDEIENLALLLSEVMLALPKANAVCSGAIESTYQRTRVESVATRLGLVPLSYLWQYPSLPAPVPMKGGLLEDMAAVGLDARIVKVACGGLEEDLLWGSLKDEAFRKKLEICVAKFGGSVLGEGGEYETLVVDGPSDLWKGFLELGETRRKIVRGEGGEAWINFKPGVVVRKVEQAETHWKNKMHSPKLWDTAFKTLLDMQDEVLAFANQNAITAFAVPTTQTDWFPKQLVSEPILWHVMITNITNIMAADDGPSTEEQMQTIKSNLLQLMRKPLRSLDDVVFTMVVLRSMADFKAFNDVYKTLFKRPNPPARVTVACGDNLPKGINVLLSLILDAGHRRLRKGLHVQSRSYWAPANIGPYSQAIAAPFSKKDTKAFMVFIAGQVPLLPASMQRYTGGTSHSSEGDLTVFWGQTCLALQHLWRVSKGAEVTWWTYGIAFFVGNSCEDIGRQALLTWLAWKKVHEPGLWQNEDQSQEDDIDAWDKPYGGQATYAKKAEESYLPDFRMKEPSMHITREGYSNSKLPGFLAVQVDELPRECSVEWHSLGLDLQGGKVMLTTHVNSAGIVAQNCYVPEEDWTIFIINIPTSLSDGEYARALSYMQVKLSGDPNTTVYTTRPIQTEAVTIPCKSLWGEGGTQLTAAIIGQYPGKPSEPPLLSIVN